MADQFNTDDMLDMYLFENTQLLIVINGLLIWSKNMRFTRFK